ncbi:uncharacterized protein L969DRAFT_89104 [Mixia osmundae IAM 14324]|nr:uncharacterized protein L969DRAFT_89104 [Mixia osmundae IAM 14324]KEI37867.1 hypothetical protein L969DRAFT_89104 [Mixia osmundae IAM 14324]
MSERPGYNYPGTPDGTDVNPQHFFPPQAENQAPSHKEDLEKVDSKAGSDGYELAVLDDATPHERRRNHKVYIEEGEHLERQLKQRHVQMISIGGVIGTGLFLGTANALRHGGPLGLFLGYTIMGSITLSVMLCLGEMISTFPLPGGHISLAKRFGDPALAFTMGWNYWYNWTIVLPAELSAAAVLVSYWISADSVNPGVWIAVCLIVVVGINLGGAKFYGEAEFWFAIIKVITIVGLIILGIIIDAGGVPGQKAIGFQYWRNPGAFVQYEEIGGALGRFVGFWTVLIQAAFSYIGTEIVALAAGEAKNPRRSIPKAIKRVYVRILLFYLVGTFVIGLIVPSNEPDLQLGSTAAKSPFVIAIKHAGIKGLPSVINAALLTSAWSAASSDMYTSSRALYALAIAGNAPRIFARTNGWGLPWPAMIVSVAFSLLAFMSAGATSAGTVFGYFANMTSVAGLLTWLGIFLTFIQWEKGTRATGLDRKSLAFTAPLMPYLAYYGAFMTSLILITNGFTVFIKIDGDFDDATFITSYLPLVMFVILYTGYKLWFKTKWILPADMDFISNSRDCPLEDEVPPRNIVEKVWNWIA